ncbi:MAK10-like protein [Tanacetum coccineum]|uniref:MAK10-like protein n=1 Tax=Tanacetum coccineum TaxID=301880 RepID=A0ABQ5A3F3_9ASTR
MGDANPIYNLGDCSKPSHEVYRNTIELSVRNNVVPLRSDTIRLVQNGCLFHGLWFEDPNQHLKDFLKLVDSLDLNARSITTWEDLTTRFLAQFFPPGRTAKLRNDILMFQQHQGESLSKAWTHFKDLLQKFPHRGIELWLQALLEDLALYDNESWNDPRDFAKPVKAISLPQDVPSTSDRRLIKLENQVQRLMENHLAPTQPTQVKKLTTSCEICSGPHDTQYCMEDPEQAFVEYASSRTDEARGLVSNFMASQDARLSKFEADFKQQQSEMTNKINIVLKAITDRIMGALPSDTVKTLNLSTSSVLFARSYPTVDPQCSSHPSTSINAIKTCSTEANISQTSQLQTGIGIGTQQLEEPEPTLEDEFQDLHLNLQVLEVLVHALIYNTLLDKYVESLELGKNGYAFVQGEVSVMMEDLGAIHSTLLADGTKSYPVGIVKDVEVHIGKLKLLNDLYVFDMKKDPETPLLIGRGFLATANAVIDRRMAKIVVGEGITRKNFLDCHLPGEWEIARDAKINPFKDVLMFRRMVEFLGAIPINLKSNMWESEDLINNPINWNKPPKNRDGAWHAKIRLIDPGGEEFTKTLQSIPTTRKLSERESPREIIDLDHFYDT